MSQWLYVSIPQLKFGHWTRQVHNSDKNSVFSVASFLLSFQLDLPSQEWHIGEKLNSRIGRLEYRFSLVTRLSYSSMHVYCLSRTTRPMPIRRVLHKTCASHLSENQRRLKSGERRQRAARRSPWILQTHHSYDLRAGEPVWIEPDRNSTLTPPAQGPVWLPISQATIPWYMSCSEQANMLVAFESSLQTSLRHVAYPFICSESTAFACKSPGQGM